MKEAAMKNETQSALVARDAAIILLLIWAFMQALLMIWAPADTQTMYLLLLFLMDIAVLCGFMDRVNTGTALAATTTSGRRCARSTRRSGRRTCSSTA